MRIGVTRMISQSSLAKADERGCVQFTSMGMVVARHGRRNSTQVPVVAQPSINQSNPTWLSPARHLGSTTGAKRSELNGAPVLIPSTERHGASFILTS